MNFLIITTYEGHLLRFQSPIASDIGSQWDDSLLPLVEQIDTWALTAQVGDVLGVPSPSGDKDFVIVRLNETATIDPEPERVQTEVSSIEVYTKLLDSGYPVRCVCGGIWRFVPHYAGSPTNEVQACPSCGRGRWNHATQITNEEYKLSRKD